MRDFRVKGIRVELQLASCAILMHPTYFSAHMAPHFRVVYADPLRLKPYMDEILKSRPQDYAEGTLKRADAQKGLLEARTQVTERLVVITPDDNNPLPMSYAGCHFLTKLTRQGFLRRAVEKELPHIGFVNGITRIFELLAQGAEFIPIEIDHRETNLLQSIVGGTRAPEPVTYYTVPYSVSRERQLDYYQRQRKGTGPTT